MKKTESGVRFVRELLGFLPMMTHRKPVKQFR
jgi:hypothetical protein